MISFDDFLKQEEADKYNMLLECNAIIQQKENIIKEVREYIEKHKKPLHHSFDEPDCDYWIATNSNDILEILNKDSDKE